MIEDTKGCKKYCSAISNEPKNHVINNYQAFLMQEMSQKHAWIIILRPSGHSRFRLNIHIGIMKYYGYMALYLFIKVVKTKFL